MNTTLYKLTQTIKKHWFVCLYLVVMLCCTFLISSQKSLFYWDSWGSPQLVELALIADLVILPSVLCFICYGNKNRYSVLKLLSLACVGVWIAGHILPDEHHSILAILGPLRFIGIAIITLVETWVIISIIRLLFGSKHSPEEKEKILVEQLDGAPEWIINIVLWEASIWGKVFGYFKKK